jgi:hypothetical protein
MPIFTETVTSFSAVEVYGGVAACKQYLGTETGAGAAAFLALSADEQKRRLISATRFIDAQIWAGAATFSVDTGPPVTTTLQWPRANVTDMNGVAVSSTAVPVGIVNGVFEMAAILATNQNATATTGDPSSRVQHVSEGPGSVTFFAPPLPRNLTALPDAVQRLVGQYLGAVDNVRYGMSSGVSPAADDLDSDNASEFSDDNQYTQTRT